MNIFMFVPDQSGRLLIDPSRNEHNLFIRMIKCNNVALVLLAMKDSRVDPSANNNYAIRMAGKNGHTEIVALLRAAVDRNNNNNS